MTSLGLLACLSFWTDKWNDSCLACAERRYGVACLSFQKIIINFGLHLRYVCCGLVPEDKISIPLRGFRTVIRLERRELALAGRSTFKVSYVLFSRHLTIPCFCLFPFASPPVSRLDAWIISSHETALWDERWWLRWYERKPKNAPFCRERDSLENGKNLKIITHVEKISRPSKRVTTLKTSKRNISDTSTVGFYLNLVDG